MAETPAAAPVKLSAMKKEVKIAAAEPVTCPLNADLALEKQEIEGSSPDFGLKQIQI